MWYSNATNQDCKALQRVVRLAERISGSALPSLQDIYLKRCKSRAVKILKDSNHPGNHLFCLLPSGKRFRSIMAKIERLRRSFFPQAIRLLNANSTLSHNIYMTQFNVYTLGTTMFAHSSCTSLFIILFIKSTVYCIAHFISLHILPLIFVFSYFYFILTYIYIYSLVLCFIFVLIFLHCPLSGPVLIYISLLIISCIIEYVTNKRTLNIEPSPYLACISGHVIVHLTKYQCIIFSELALGLPHTGCFFSVGVRLRFPVSCVSVPIFGFLVIISSLVPVCV